ncbi:MAG: glucose-1-phosphate adenylyltransferase subunit GlgD, partial [Clostridia bacterium]|nr:glucose-1-phosphate adenylyltransferase subunit GlgD [Clostridia bacterium]
MSLIGIILSGIYSDALDPLVKDRTFASLPFGGRYRQIDFILSNMVNSGILSVGIITKSNYQSLLDHLGSCQDWDMNRKFGGVTIIPPYATGNYGGYRGKIEELRAAFRFLNSNQADSVVVADAGTICNLDLKAVADYRISSGADIVVVASPVREDEKEPSELVLDQADGGVSGIYLNRNAVSGQFSSDGIYVFSKEFLLREIERFASLGYYHLERDLIQQGFNTGRLKVAVFPFEGTVLKNRSILEYFRNNLALKDPEVRKNLFRRGRPIYTAVRDEKPAYYGRESLVRDCLVADGCRIHGSATRSVLFRSVSIGKD